MIKKYTFTEKKDTRSGFGAGLLELGKSNPDVVALCADLTGSLKMDAFQKEFPNRFFQAGIAEANMIGLAAGLATAGKIPFTGTFANFSTGRVYDQIRQSVAYSDKHVKICASHAGLTLGEDGATHQILEDIGMMRMLPNMTVVCPADYLQTKQATLAIAQHHGPVYLRFGRPSWPVFIPSDLPFEIGKAQVLQQGGDVTIIATGHLVWKALQAAEALYEKVFPPRSSICIPLNLWMGKRSYAPLWKPVVWSQLRSINVMGDWEKPLHNFWQPITRHQWKWLQSMTPSVKVAHLTSFW